MQIYLAAYDFEKRRERTFFVGVCVHMLLHNNNVIDLLDGVYKGKHVFTYSSSVLIESSLYPNNSQTVKGYSSIFTVTTD
jgi:hypothetical protein